MSLKNFVFIYPLPQCAKVIEGYYDPSNINNEFSANDVIEVTRVKTVININSINRLINLYLMLVITFNHLQWVTSTMIQIRSGSPPLHC